MTTKISNTSLIQGIFKEALFLEVIGQIIKDGVNIGSFKVLDILEEDNFAKDDQKLLTLGLYEELKDNIDELNFFLPLGIANIEFNSEPTEITKKQITIKLPETITNKENRSAKRHKFTAEFSNGSEVILAKETTAHESILSLSDFSNGSFGGVLKSSTGVVPRVNDKIKGFFNYNGTSIKLDHNIARITPLNDENCYNIGIQKVETKPNPQTLLKTKRKTRFKTEETLELESILSEGRFFKLNVHDISILGFSGSISGSRTEHVLLQPGFHFRIPKYGLIVELHEHTDESLRFKITEGSKEERLKWLKSYDYLMEGTSDSHSMAEEMLRLFCESGALSSNHINRNKHISNDFKNLFSRTDQNEPWLHRWISTNQEGEPNGHISSLRYSDNSWIIGDIVGSQNKNNKMPKSVRHNYLRAFSEWSLSSTPSPTHLIMWLKDHPYWKAYENIIQEPGPREQVLCTADLHYSRLSPLNSEKACISSKLIKVKASDHYLINKTLKDFEVIGLRPLVESFDFNNTNFSSPFLKKTFLNKSKNFNRKFFILNHGGFKGLVVFTLYPKGATLNKVPDSIWFFEIDSGTEHEWQKTANTLQHLALLNGISAPSIRRVTTNSNKSPFSSEKHTLKCFLVSPSFWIKAQELML